MLQYWLIKNWGQCYLFCPKFSPSSKLYPNYPIFPSSFPMTCPRFFRNRSDSCQQSFHKNLTFLSNLVPKILHTTLWNPMYWNIIWLACRCYFLCLWRDVDVVKYTALYNCFFHWIKMQCKIPKNKTFLFKCSMAFLKIIFPLSDVKLNFTI